MELRHLGDSFLKARAPLLSFLAPSVPRSWWSIASSRPAQTFLTQMTKDPSSSFHTAACLSADSPFAAADNKKPQQNVPKAKGSSAADIDSSGASSRSTTTLQAQSPFPQRASADQTVSSLLDQTLANLPNPAKRERSTPNPPSSADNMQKAWSSFVDRRVGQRSPGQFAQNMKFPTPASRENDPSQSVVNDIRMRPNPRAKRTVRPRPTIGRTVEVSRGRGHDLGKALRSLNILCAVNKVRADQIRQRFHERPGLKRKRLKSERWRKLFKESFRMTVARVQQMKKKGW